MVSAPTTADRRRPARLLPVLVVVCAFVAWPAPAGTNAAGAAVQREAGTDAPLDLAAMALTPADLEAEGLEGYGIADGATRPPHDVAGAFAFRRAVPDDEAHELFAAAGLEQAYELRLDLPAETGDGVARSVTSTIQEYADADGAADAFAAVTDVDGVATAEVIALDATVGDASVLTRHVGTTAMPFHALDQTFQSGAVTAEIRLIDFQGDEPAVADAEGLAARLLERIEVGLDRRATGISAQALRLAGEGVVPNWDYYTLYDGDAPAADADAFAEEMADVGLIDEFMVGHRIVIADQPEGDAYVYAIVQRFADEEAASAYLGGVLAERTESDRFEDLTELEDVAEYGDETVAYTQTYHWETNDVDLTYQSYHLRVGAVLALVEIVSPEAPPVAALEELAAAQAACLEDGACRDPAPLPADLRSLVEAAQGSDDADRAARDRGSMPPHERGWTGADFGVELTYDRAAWEPVAEESPDDDDALILFANAGRSVLTLSAVGDDSGAEVCVAELTAGLADEEALGQARPVWDEAGEPIAGGDAERAYAAYGAILDDGSRTFAYVECRSFAGGEATLFIFHVGPLDRYEQQAAAREELLDGLVLPAA